MKFYKMTAFCVSLILLSTCAFGCKKEETKPYEGGKTLDVIKTDYDIPTVQNGVYTFSQISGAYQAENMTSVDMPVAYGLTKTGVTSMINSYKNKGFKTIGMMIPMGRDATNSEYTKTIDDSIVQKRSDGSVVTHPGGCPYVYPSEGFAKWLAEWGIAAANAGAEYIFVEEPDGFVVGAYSDYLKEQWQVEYSEEWKDADSFENPLDYSHKRDKLLGKIFVNAYKVFADTVKAKHPNVKIVLATHTSIDYAGNHKIAADNYRILSLDNIDGLVVQAWTDTSLVKVYHNGILNHMPFENSFLQYSEGNNYLRGLENKVIYTLADASADGGYPFDVTRPIYQDNIVAQCLMPDVYSYESNIWPDRSFVKASEDYKTVQEGIMQMQRELYQYGVTSYSGNRGVGVLMSYNSVSFSNFMSSSGYIQAMSVPLLRSGIPVEILTLESMTSAASLKDIKVLVLSYDFMKPEDAMMNITISNWVKEGGVLVYVGGESLSPFFNSLNAWWNNNGYETPQEHLFESLGLDVKSKIIEETALTRSSLAPSYFTNFEVTGNSNITEYTLANGRTLFSAGESAVVSEVSCGKGYVTLLGVEPNGVSSNIESTAAYSQIIKNAIFRAKMDYSTPEYLRATRGDYEIIRTFGKEVVLDGKYVDLFDNNFAIVTNPKVPVNSSKVYKKVTDKSLIVSSSSISNYVENASKITFTATNSIKSRMQTKIKVPNGKTATVTVKDANNMSPANLTFSTELGILTIKYTQLNLGKYTVTVNFS